MNDTIPALEETDQYCDSENINKEVLYGLKTRLDAITGDIKDFIIDQAAAHE
jgi:hypothetical protein